MNDCLRLSSRSSSPDEGRRRSPLRNRRRPSRRHRLVRRLLSAPAARSRPLVQESLQAVDKRPKCDAATRTPDHRTKASTRLRRHSWRQPPTRPDPPTARRSPPSDRRVGRQQGPRAEDCRERPLRSLADETTSGPAAGHSGHTQLTAPAPTAPRSQPNRAPNPLPRLSP